MKIYENGIYRDLTAKEIAEREAQTKAAEAEYWATIPYDAAVNNEIRKCYSESAEFAILRQKEDKPQEYAEYYAYCEKCKAFVKEKKSIVL